MLKPLEENIAAVMEYVKGQKRMSRSIHFSRAMSIVCALCVLALAGCGGLSQRADKLPTIAAEVRPTDASTGPSREATPTESQPAGFEIVGSPPQGQLYHGVYPGGKTGEEDDLTLDDLKSYTQSAGKPVAWVYFSNNWYRSREFPTKTAEWIRDAGSVPYIRLMLRSDAEQNHAEPEFTLERIADGDFDGDLRAWARAARDFGTPLIAEFGTEVNGEWFPWNGVWNGGGAPAGYGDPNAPDGPERFRDAYRHIVQIARDGGALNAIWVFHANNQDVPVEDWNRLEEYYPGNAWIDWIGVSVYGAQAPMDAEWPSFREMMDEVYPRLAALSADQPIVVLEFGATANNPLGDQAEWARAALSDITASRWPRVIGFSWWSEAWQNDDDPTHNTTMRLQDNPDLAAVFAELVGRNPDVLDQFSTGTR